MARIIFNAQLSKIKKNKASGVSAAVRGKELVGFMDVRKTIYKNKSTHTAGLKYDAPKRTFYLTDPKKADDVKLAVFISSYETRVEDGRVLKKEHLKNVYELPSVAYKFEIGGYKDQIMKEKKSVVEVFPHKINLYIQILSAKEKVIIVNSKGVKFVCDFKSEQWYTMRPGESNYSIYRMEEDDLVSQRLFKNELPFPALDRKLYDNKKVMAGKKFDLDKHALRFV